MIVSLGDPNLPVQPMASASVILESLTILFSVLPDPQNSNRKGVVTRSILRLAETKVRGFSLTIASVSQVLMGVFFEIYKIGQMKVVSK